VDDSRPAPDITLLLSEWRQGNPVALDALMRHVYATVRAIAARSLRTQPAATLSATDLAHEALLRLLGSDMECADRHHFFRVAAQATRQVLIDTARKRLAGKRGGNPAHVELDEAHAVAAPESDTQLVRLDDALRDLAVRNERHAQMIELVYFGGFSRGEVAAALGLSDTTVDRDLRVARAWLKDALAA